VHVDPPAEHKAYLHRSGRTARAGARGAVVTLVTPDQVRDVTSLLRQAGIRPALSHVVPGDPQTAALTGPAADRRPPAAAPGAGRPPTKPATDRAPVSTGRRSKGRPGGPPRRVTRMGHGRSSSR
jgi:superfamily II DNA/RNA helicase